MFENIIGQTSIVGTLRQEVESNSLPSAILFHGSPFTGKLSTALELARVLTCSREGKWSCTCPACRKQRLLIHPNTLLLGWRYFDMEIAAAADSLRRTRRLSAQYLFVRAVRKLTRRFDPIIWEGEESKIRRIESTLTEIEEHLDTFEPVFPGEQVMDYQRLDRRLERVVALAQTLSKSLSRENVPINQLRRASAWMHMTVLSGASTEREQASGTKIVILEGADRMYDSSSNYLLKLLEEPPPESYLVLITTRRSALIPTVRSRLRPYSFGERTPASQREVLQRIFHEQSDDYGDLREYFLYWQDVNPTRLKSLARRFIEAALADEKDSVGEEVLAEIGENLTPKTGRGFVSSFLEEILCQLMVLLRGQAVDPFMLKRWNRTIRRHQHSFFTFNQQPSLIVESLYYALRTVR